MYSSSSCKLPATSISYFRQSKAEVLSNDDHWGEEVFSPRDLFVMPNNSFSTTFKRAVLAYENVMSILLLLLGRDRS